MKLILYFMRAYPARSFLMLICLLFAGVADGVGLMTLLPILNSLASNGTELKSTGHEVFAYKAIEMFGLEPSTSVLLLLMLGVIYTKGLLMLLAMRQAGYTVAHVTNDLRLKLIRALMAANWPYYISRPSGYFSNAVGTEAMRAAMAYHHAVLLIAAIVQVVVYSFVALTLSWRVALITFLVGFVALYLMRGLIRTSREAGRKQTDLMRSLISRLTDTLQGIKPLKAMALEGNVQPLLEADSEELNKMQQRTVLASEVVNSLQEPLMATMVAAGIYFLFLVGGTPFPALLILIFLFSKLLQRLYYAQRCYQEIGAQESALWAILESISSAEKEKEGLLEEGFEPELKRTISVDRVVFGYDDRPVLNEVSIEIPKGRFVAIIGPSGGGKTTLVDLLIGLLKPKNGEIKVDGVPLEKINLKKWRGKIGYVPQEMLLFHDSILHNITLGNSVITRDQVEQALRRADAWNFICSLPKGLDTSIGERGSKLSGGQRQRLSIARALVRNPSILILDEITSALDPISANEICSTLQKLSGYVTILAISHQQEIISYADFVYELINGKLNIKQQNASTVLGN